MLLPMWDNIPCPVMKAMETAGNSHIDGCPICQVWINELQVRAMVGAEVIGPELMKEAVETAMAPLPDDPEPRERKEP